MNSIYLFDIDGTLSKDGIIPASTIHALKELRKQKNLVFLATGRCLGQLKEILVQIEVDGMILNNGALILIHNEVIFSKPIPIDIIKKMIEDGLHLAFLTQQEYLRIEDHVIFNDFVKVFSIQKPNLIAFEDLKKIPIYSLGVYDKNLTSISKEKYPDLRFVQVCPIGYDVMLKKINKASGINEIKSRYPDYKIIAFGDNYNDIELLDKADIAIVMGSAPKDVKEYADFITKNVFEDGIYYALKNYIKSI